jgi:hypothetical protein
MPDQFDIQRNLDNAGEALLDTAMEKLEDAKEKAREKAVREDPASESHPKNHPKA